MGYYEFKIKMDEFVKDAVINLLMESNSNGVIEEDDVLISYFDDIYGIERIKNIMDSIKENIRKNIPGHEIDYEYMYISERDWNETWKKRFVPLHAGERLVVIPPWARCPDGMIPVIIDPGMAFGTGHHETTMRCLTLIERYASGVESMLDIGTGTGILAIAGSKLGVRNITAIDIDPLAIIAVERNTKLNGIENIRIIHGSIDDVSGEFSMIVANLLFNTLIEIRNKIIMRLKDHGILILSGILEEQNEELMKSYKSSHLELIESCHDNKWVSTVFKKISR